MRVFLSINDLRVIADEHGSREFMEGFREYVRRQHIPNLFYDADVWFENSQVQPLIQLADFLAGTVGHALRLGAGVPVDEILKRLDRKSTRLNSSHVAISYAVFCLKKIIRYHTI